MRSDSVSDSELDALLRDPGGTGVGMMVVLLAGKIIAASVYGVSPRDPLALTLAMAVFTSVALIASAVPAWRTSWVDPAVAPRNSE
ncbi:MAG TPA: hypothetical protein VFK39_08530 [Gemmatimonadaceae bacterium]|nr:hypothetical protein [Gemmatimonadaceae bacterium]